MRFVHACVTIICNGDLDQYSIQPVAIMRMWPQYEAVCEARAHPVVPRGLEGRLSGPGVPFLIQYRIQLVPSSRLVTWLQGLAPWPTVAEQLVALIVGRAPGSQAADGYFLRYDVFLAVKLFV